MIFPFGSLAFADVPTPLAQINSGVEPHDIQCNENKVLVERSNGKVACVSEITAEKTGWNVIVIQFKDSIDVTDSATVTTSVPSEEDKTDILLELSDETIELLPVSNVEFNVQSTDTYDNNIKINGFSDMATRSPPPIPLTKFENQYNSNQIIKRSISFSESTMDSISRDLSPYMWIPSYTPDGMNLILNSWTNDEKFYLYLLYAPNTYNVDENTTNQDIWNNHGIDIQVYDNSIRTNGLERFEDYREDRLESISIESDNGLVDYTFNGHATLSSNGDGSRPSVLEYADNEYLVSVVSYGHSFDELKTIFESMWYE